MRSPSSREKQLRTERVDVPRAVVTMGAAHKGPCHSPYGSSPPRRDTSAETTPQESRPAQLDRMPQHQELAQAARYLA